MLHSSLLLLPIVFVLSFSLVSVIVSGQNATCYDTGNFTANDNFQTTLYGILDSIATTTSSTMTYGLFNASTSQQQNTDPIEVIGYCRGDLDGDACRACLNASAYEIRQHCPLQKKAVFYNVTFCTLKYSNGPLYGIVNMTQGFPWLSNINQSNWETFATGLHQLLDDLRGQASSGGTIRKYAQGTAPSVELETLYATVQCSPDLSGQQCSDCLVDVTGLLPTGKIGARMLWPSCQFRYEISRFFDPIAVPLPPPPPPPPPPPGKRSKTWIIIVVSMVSTVLIGIIGFLITIKRKRRRRFLRRLENEDADDDIIVESLQFNLDLIAEATDNFSDAKKLGQGGFGSVYLGKLPNGQKIAVKRLSKNSGQGELEFKNEVVLLARLQHRNLVILLGFCYEGDERLLIYEFVPNSSLDQFIFDPLKRARLDWDTRYKIITGIARGLVYLHEDSRLRIIHRDLKASNILLDMDMNPKVSDFGMARLFELDQTQADTNRIVGTYGYMAPEYVLHGHFSMKSDVFSFGVLVLEIVSGRRNANTDPSGGGPEILISNIWRSWREGRIPSIVDPLVTSCYSADIVRSVHIGLLCVQENETNRPTMASVVLMLNSHSVTLAVPTQPAFLMSTSYTSEISSSFDGTLAESQGDRNRNNMDMGTNSVNEISVTEPCPR